MVNMRNDKLNTWCYLLFTVSTLIPTLHVLRLYAYIDPSSRLTVLQVSPGIEFNAT
ncbi:hypothetical protein GYMLUDRAFT_367691 [Collybiopsis luxurians FD-317 M1]|nr:hypothetical protein GYMLUDRAFT_367691 [Collybiopsis luxurians FD-317 M1]